MGTGYGAYEDTRKWVRVFNVSDETIPPFGTVFCSGKRYFGQEFDEKTLPKEKAINGKYSWDELQQEVGYGNLLLVANKAFDGWGFGFYNYGGWWHNGPVPIPAGQWGKVTRDYPVIARIKVLGNENAIVNSGIGFTRFVYHVAGNSFNLQAAYNSDGYSQFGWNGWGNPFGYQYNYSNLGWGGGMMGFWAVDIIDSFVIDKEALAWVMPSGAIVRPNYYSFNLDTTALAEGNRDLAVNLILPGTSNTPRRTEGTLFNDEDNFISIATPGLYRLEMRFSVYGRSIPLSNNENPWSQLKFTIDTEFPGSELGSNYFSMGSKGGFATVAPPVIKQGFPSVAYGPPAPSTYLEQFLETSISWDFVISEPKDWDPGKSKPPTLFKFRFEAERTTNAPTEMNVDCSGHGTLTVTETSTRTESDDNLLTPGG